MYVNDIFTVCDEVIVPFTTRTISEPSEVMLAITIEDVKFAIELGLVPKENRYDYTMQKIELMLKEMMEDK